MSLVKRTYSLPETVLGPFESQVPTGRRSTVLADLLQQWLDRQRRARLRQEIAEGCAAMADVYLEVEREFHPLEEEVHRALEGQPQARRRRSHSPRSRRRVRASR